MRLLPFARLLRIPNVFTAFADIALGGLATGLVRADPLAFALLCLASGALYCAGMVWNDWFDQDQDARERPFRPLPSGAVSPRLAALIGTLLLAVGLAAGGAAAWRASDPSPAVLAGLIAVAVLLYDGWLKRTPAGPVSMAACRFLNVLLGVSVAGEAMPWAGRLHLAAVVGLYIVGVTWFARREAASSSRRQLRLAAGVGLAALVLALPLPMHQPPGASSPLFVYLLTAFGVYVGMPAVRAARDPSPTNVQSAVKRAVLGLVALDAVLATATPAGIAGLFILLLLPPALWLGRRVYST